MTRRIVSRLITRFGAPRKRAASLLGPKFIFSSWSAEYLKKDGYLGDRGSLNNMTEDDDVWKGFKKFIGN